VDAGKRQRLREHGIWLMEEEAYFTQGNFLVITHPEEGYRHIVEKYAAVASVCEPTDPVQSKCWHGARLTAKSVADGKLDPRDPERYEFLPSFQRPPGTPAPTVRVVRRISPFGRLDGPPQPAPGYSDSGLGIGPVGATTGWDPKLQAWMRMRCAAASRPALTVVRDLPSALEPLTVPKPQP
jgi:hypothetical protein